MILHNFMHAAPTWAFLSIQSYASDETLFANTSSLIVLVGWTPGAFQPIHRTFHSNDMRARTLPPAELSAPAPSIKGGKDPRVAGTTRNA